jgi:hypothetical protein
MKTKYLVIVFLLIVTPAFAKEKVIFNDVEYEISQEREIKDKLRVKFYKKDGETYLAKKIKLKDNKKDWEIVNA